MSAKKSYQNWCKNCKFHERNLSKCIACLVQFGTAEIGKPPEFVKRVKP